MTVTDGQTANKTSAGDRAVDDGDDVGQLSLEGRVKVGTATDSYETVGVGEASKDADLG